jgi:medium-chain acyl-[acyl-carrier-protein] hydrolase
VPTEQRSLADMAEGRVADLLAGVDGGGASTLAREARSLLLPFLRADLEVWDTYEYEPGPPLDCPIAAFGGAFDELVGVRDLDAWRDQTSARFGGVRLLPGDHFFLHRAQGVLVPAVARELATISPGPG